MRRQRSRRADIGGIIPGPKLRKGDPRPSWTAFDAAAWETLKPVKKRIDDLGKVIRFLREKGADSQKNMIPTIYRVQDKVIRDAFRKLDAVRQR